jgi:sigma-E factor negative regulatory protein RseC
MSAETGTVIELVGNEARVVMNGSNACRSCAARQACSTLGGNSKTLMIKNILNALPGDRIEFTIEEKGVIISSFIVYLLPLLFLILGMVIGSSFHAQFARDQDVTAMLGGLAGLCFSFILIKTFNHLFRKKTLFMPKMLRIINMENDGKNIKNGLSCADNY